MTNNKNSFLIYMNWATIAVNLPEELAGQLFIAICAMQTGKDYEIKDPAIKAIFASIEEKMNEDAESWKKTCERKSEAGKKGGEAKASKTKHEPSKTKHEPSTAKQDQADNENVTDKDNDKDKEKGAYAPKEKACERYFDNGWLNEKYKDWLAYKKRLGDPLTSGKRINASIERLTNHSRDSSGNLDPVIAVKVIEQAMNNGWQNFYPLDKPPEKAGTTKKSSFTDFNQRKYNFNNLEKQLLAK